MAIEIKSIDDLKKLSFGDDFVVVNPFIDPIKADEHEQTVSAEIYAAAEAMFAPKVVSVSADEGLPLTDREYVLQQVSDMTAEEITKRFLKDETKDFARRLGLKVGGKEVEIAARIVEALQ